MDWRLTVAGLLVGTLAGMSGIGGSSLLAPILIVFFGVKASIAVGTDLLYSVPVKALAAYAHLRQGTVDRRLVVLLASGGIPGALAGLTAFVFARTHLGEAQLEQILRHAIGVVILCAAAATLVVTSIARGAPLTPRPRATIAVGAVVGFLVALTSLGSGSVTLPFLLLVLPAMRLRSLIGSEIVFAAILVPVAAAGHVAFSDVDWRMVLSLTLGALPGAYLGARLCAFLGERSLRPAVIGILAFAGYRLL
ncbi:MAG: sulfite exporter TauE/SafE family protein [Candidatus Elarobacter sp.]